ncbi:MAG: ABC transporter ATP-binding protein [Gammaproteobacteria bacterium]|nr:ABC transporter ATP-binding protein [Gammaproteobacteria bacterium]
MDPSLYRYILKHSRNGQIVLIALSLLSLPIVYVTLELPKRIINMLEGLELPESVLGYEVDQISYLMLLSSAFLLAVLINGSIKYVINVYRGALGERLLWRFRYELYERILRFPVPHFKRVSQGELIPMITAETEPLAEFIGESYSLPVFQGGILFTYLFFIFQQDVFLGLAAVALYPFQLYVIPRLQKRVNALAKERVAMVRSLSGRIGETVSGINEVHTNDTSHYERAQIGHRLGSIYRIRFAIFRRKFFIKFLNNFIAQLTPFFFYSAGGYFVLRGELSIGSMVAVLVAYKDLAGPWKELLRYYQRKEDIKVKYTQVIEQFNPANLLDPMILNTDLDTVQLPEGDLHASGISYSEDGLYFSIEDVSFKMGLDQHIAAVGLSNSGKDEMACLLSRLINPSAGTITIGAQKMADMPEALTGRRLGYVGQNTYLFTGSVRDNLLYPLKHRPITTAETEDKKQRGLDTQLAMQAGSSLHSIHDNWIDYSAIGIENEAQFSERVHQLLTIVELDEDIYQFGLLSYVDQSQNADLPRRIMLARKQLRNLLSQPAYKRLVEPFDQDRYNTNLTVADNLLFGTIYDDSIDTGSLADNPYIRKVLDEAELTDDFLSAGKQIAEIMLDLFSDVEPDSKLFEQFSFISADDLPEFQQLLGRTKEQTPASFSDSDRISLLSLSFKLVVARHRLGLINESIQTRILLARKRIRDESSENDLGIEFFDENRYNPRISIQDNILFGKLAYGQANAQAKINELIVGVIESLELRADITEIGLAYEVGVGGARLSVTQRQKLGLVRCLIKKPDLLIVNEAMAGLDTAAERRLIKRVREQMQSRGIFWVLARAQLAENFDSVMVMVRGKLVANDPYQELVENNPHFQQLLEDE